MKIIKKSFPKFAVVGAGNGGLAIAGYLSSSGYIVNLYNRSLDKFANLVDTRRVVLQGSIQAEGYLNIVTDDIERAIEDVNVIMIVVPASAHRAVAANMAPYLTDGQIIILNPGRTGGALEFKNAVKQLNPDVRITVAEAQTLLYACRRVNECTVKIFSVKERVALAAIPATRTGKVIKMISQVFPQFVPAKNVLETSFNNIGAIFHPAPTLLNSARIETTGGNFQYYLEGISPTVARILEQMDRERIAVAERFGINTISALKWLQQSYNVEDTSLYGALQKNNAYKGIKAPSTVDNRYLFEDVPASLVPISSIGKMIGIPTPTIDSIIQLACVAQNVDYWKSGRTVETLGLAGKTVKEINRMVMEEEKDIIENMEEVVA